MPNFNKKSLLILLLFLAVLGFVIYAEQKTNAYKKVLSEKEALLIIDYGQGKQRWFKGEVRDGMTVFDALTTASLAGNFNFQANSHLTLLDNLTSNEKSKWTCYLNNKEITEPLNKITIRPKDKIVCRYR